MEKTSKILTLTCVFCSFFYLSCGDDNKNDVPSDDSQPVIENLAVNPVSVSYSNTVVLTGNFSDQKGLQSYTIKLSNSEGNIYETTKMLTGKTFALNDNLVIVLPKNAKAGNVTISLTLKNSDGGSITEELVLQNVKIPVFEQLYLLLGTKVCLLEKIENVFVYEDIIPANATGKIYVNSDKTGMFWGRQSGNAETMANEDFVIGKGTETSLRVTFNPVTFELLIEEAERWVETDEPVYIYGDISGHWADGPINEEKAKMKMQGYASGNKRYWSWTPPSTGSGDPIDDMWGNINPGKFRFKKGSVEEYVLFNGTTIIKGSTNDQVQSFLTTIGGPITIKLFFDGTNYNKVSLEGSDKSLDYTPNGIQINGSPAPTAITFAGSPLALKEGTFYTYEGTLDLTKDQNITALGTDLRTANPDPDVFTGNGNATWKMIGSTGKWLIRIDPFASNLYACKQSGYPDVIYMDGWSWAKFDSDATISWNPEARLCLQRESADSYIYTSTFYNNGWGGDVSFWAAPPSAADFGKKVIASTYFDGVEPSSETNLNMPTAAGYYKVSVDLKTGISYSENINPELIGASYFTLIPESQRFTVTFTPQ